MGTPYGWRSLVAIIAAGALALTVCVLAFLKLPNLSLEHLSSPYVKVLQHSETGQEIGHGSGSYLGNGYVLTAAHVLRDAPALSVQDEDGNVYKATVIIEDKDTDVGIIRIELAAIKPAKLSCVDPAKNTAITMTGNPLGMDFITVRGFIAKAAHSVWVYKSVLILDMTAAQGASGAGIIDPAGRIVGIPLAVAQMNGTALPLALAAPPSVFCPFLKQAGAI